jgi:beta-1,4-N-acetylglucosaminyltransferase
MPRKACFVTVGATASFEALIRAVYDPQFLRSLADTGYTKLVVQCGKGGTKLCDALLSEALKHASFGITVSSFEFTQHMMQDMRIAKAEDGRDEGVVLCHAGIDMS